MNGKRIRLEMVDSKLIAGYRLNDGKAQVSGFRRIALTTEAKSCRGFAGK